MLFAIPFTLLTMNFVVYLSQWLFTSLTYLIWRFRVSEVNMKDVTLKSYSLKIGTNSVNQILRDNEKITETCNINILATITDQKILCVYSWGPGPYNSLYQADNRKYFLGLSLTWDWREVHMFHLARVVRKNLEIFLLRKR